MALINPCTLITAGQNTGTECSKHLDAPKGIILVPASAKWQDSDLATFSTYINTKIHATKSQRWYPIFASLVNVENSEEADTLETFPSGATSFVKYGPYSRTFSFNAGGTCLAKAMQSFNKLGYRFIEVDINGKVAFRKNSDGSYSGLKPNELYSPKPHLQDLTTTYLNKVYINIMPQELIQNAIIFSNDEDLTNLMGLIDVKLVVGNAGASSTTKLKFNIQTECAGTDLIDLLGNAWADTTNFVVTKADGTTPSISAAAIVNGHLELTGTFSSSGVYTVAGAAPSILLSNDIQGYEITTPVTITIP